MLSDLAYDLRWCEDVLVLLKSQTIRNIKKELIIPFFLFFLVSPNKTVKSAFRDLVGDCAQTIIDQKPEEFLESLCELLTCILEAEVEAALDIWQDIFLRVEKFLVPAATQCMMT